MFGRTKSLFSASLMGPLAYACTNYDFSGFSPSVYCFTAPPTRDQIRGEYENKIRRMSPPEKIFEVFATKKQGHDIYMTHLDLFKALCPYNYSTKARDYSKKEEPFESSALVQFADSDRDGFISLYEYYFFVCFMQTTTEDFEKFFNSLSDRTITREEVKNFLEFIQNTKGKLTIPKMLPDPRKQHLSREGLEQVREKIVDNLFEKGDAIRLSKLLGLRELIYAELYKFEFNTFELEENGNIKGEDFAKSIICYLDPAIVPKYWRTLDKLQWEGSVSLDEYIAFQRFLRENLHKMEEEIKEKGVISRKKLKETITRYCEKENVKINDAQIDTFIRVVDHNQNNRIDHNEFVGVVQNRSFYGSGETAQKLEKPFVVLKKKLEVYANKLERMYEILIE